MDLRKVKKLIELLESSNIAEIEIHEGEESVRISRASRAAPQQQMVEAAPLAAAPAAPAAEPAPAPADPAPPEEPEGHLVTAPMVGTFYAAPTPGSPPYVEPGASVERGEVLCIIEAMKIMNPIESDSAGVVRAVLVDNGQPVEYGQPLFVLEE